MNGTSSRGPMAQREITFIGAIRGPILLITIGVLFAIDHSGGYSFWRTWPAVLIVVGILKLLERAVESRGGTL